MDRDYMDLIVEEPDEKPDQPTRKPYHPPPPEPSPWWADVIGVLLWILVVVGLILFVWLWGYFDLPGQGGGRL